MLTVRFGKRWGRGAYLYVRHEEGGLLLDRTEFNAYDEFTLARNILEQGLGGGREWGGGAYFFIEQEVGGWGGTYFSDIQTQFNAYDEFTLARNVLEQGLGVGRDWVGRLTSLSDKRWGEGWYLLLYRAEFNAYDEFTLARNVLEHVCLETS